MSSKPCQDKGGKRNAAVGRCEENRDARMEDAGLDRGDGEEGTVTTDSEVSGTNKTAAVKYGRKSDGNKPRRNVQNKISTPPIAETCAHLDLWSGEPRL